MLITSNTPVKRPTRVSQSIGASGSTPTDTFESTAGQQQSPIILRDAIAAHFGERGLRLDWASNGQPVSGVPKRGGHGLHLDVEGPPLTIGLERKRFELKGFHFHSPSEHHLGERQFPMEMHLVHQCPEDGTRAVVGVFVEKADPSEADPAMGQFLRDVARAEKTGETVSVEPATILPSDPDQYYRYEGSLTTPGYDENVSWVVMRRPLLVSEEDLNELKHLFESPARPPQPLERRFVLASFES